MLPTVLYFSDLAIMGGGEVCLAGLLSKLDRDRFRPLVVAPERGPLLDAVGELGIDSRPIRLFTGMRAWRIKKYLYLHVHARLRRNLARLAELLSREEVALVHTHGGMYPQNIRHLGRLARAAGIPVVWTCGHGGSYAPDVMAELIAPWVDRVIAVSASVRDRLLATGILRGERITVLHHGLDLEVWRAAPADTEFRRELGAGESDVLVGTVGRVVAVKGHDVFLDAVARLVRDEPRARFVVVGDQRPDEGTGGRYFRELMLRADRLGLSGRLVFAGWRENARQVMAALDVLVQPSRQEAFGRTLLEAMAMGKPVVATRVGGMPEVVEDGRTGLLVPPEDPHALADAIRLLVRDRVKARAMGEAGRERVARSFSLADRTRLVEAIYEEMLAAPAAGPLLPAMAVGEGA